jgi:hypothetical protein
MDRSASVYANVDRSFNPQPKAQAEHPEAFACGSGLNDFGKHSIQ